MTSQLFNPATWAAWLDLPQMTWLEWLVTVGKFALVFIPLAFIVVMITTERKGASLMQDRMGPNRSAIPIFGGIRIFGFVHNFSDGIKLFTKESFIPAQAHKVAYVLAPAIGFMIAFLTPSIIPWFAPLTWWTGSTVAHVSGLILNSDNGILLMFALSSLGVYGTVMSSWASNSKYALLGGMRAGALMISYEVSMGLSLMGMFLLAGSFNLQDIVAWQETHVWGIIAQPIALLVFLTSMIAETGRAPFDVAEGESEIVAGYHLEYSAMRFGLFYMGEYAHITIASLVIATLFLGGYSIPFVSTDLLRAHVGVALGLALLAFALMLGVFLFMVTRWKKVHAGFHAKDSKDRALEYTVMQILAAAGVLGLLVAAIASFALLHPAPATVVDGVSIYPAWVSLAAAAVQLVVLIAKAFIFCWIWVWVRWTLPRFRYDQVMGLCWKILLNVALLNLLVTAVVAKLLTGVR